MDHENFCVISYSRRCFLLYEVRNGYYLTKQYYVKVTTDSKVENEKLSNGEVLTYHVYDEKVYDKKEERELKISLQNELEKINII